MSVAQFKTNWGTNHDMYRINSWGTGDWSNYKFQKWRLHDYMIQTDGDESEKTVFFNNSVNADGEIPLSEIGMSFLDDKVGIGTTDPKTALQIGDENPAASGDGIGGWGDHHMEPSSLSIINNPVSAAVGSKTMIDMVRWGRGSYAYGARCQIKF